MPENENILKKGFLKQLFKEISTVKVFARRMKFVLSLM
jgi:hypothetical protein